jgi:hypothetical protein
VPRIDRCGVRRPRLSSRRDPIQRVVAVAAVAQLLLLDAAADLVDDLCAEPDDVEGVQDGDRVG